MKINSNQSKFKNQKFKTLCTLDTSDIVLGNDAKQQMYRKRGQSSLPRNRKHSILKHGHRNDALQTIVSKQRAFSNNIERWNNTQLRTKTPNSQKKKSQHFSKSRIRMKTECDQNSVKKIVLKNLQIFTTVKNVKFQMDEQYNVDPFYLVDTIKSTHQQTISMVKFLQRNKKVTYYIMKKSNHFRTISKYEKQIKMKQQLTDLLKPQQKNKFSCIYKVYRKDRNNNMFVVYHMEGQPLSWKKAIHKKLIHNLAKNNMQIMKHLIVQISKAIYILSSYGYYHSQLKLKSILLQVKQDQQNVKVSKIVKLRNIFKCQKVSDKKLLQNMSLSIYTPPQILNFIMFQKQSKNFNRSWLDYIYRYQDGWRINVWSLGILVLELLNEQPLQNTFIQVEQIIEFQKQIWSKCNYLIDRITDQGLQKILKKMLSINPQQRPSPQQIIISLTA